MIISHHKGYHINAPSPNKGPCWFFTFFFSWKSGIREGIVKLLENEEN